MNNLLSDVDVAALLRLAGEVGEVVQDLHERRAQILDGLLAVVGGCSAVCSEIDPDNGMGWAVPDSITCSGGTSGDQQAMIDRYLTGHLSALDPCIPPLLRQEEAVFTVARADVIDDSSWHRSEHFNHLRRPLGFGESMYAKLKTPDGRKLKLSFHREMNDRAFTRREVGLVQMFNENLGGLYGGGSRRQAAAAKPDEDERIESLPLRLRPVLRRLLKGDAEKQAALTLGLSPHTVHEYTKLLYRAFGVNSRGELLARFVVGA